MLSQYFECVDELPRTKSAGGIFVHKHRVRAAFRIVSFLALIVVASLFNSYVKYNQNGNSVGSLDLRRRLQDEDGNGSNMNGLFQIVADPTWLLAPYIFGVLYMFLALAIVCDEYFVPALEVMSGEYHLNLTPDISGATLMAAGGSAPELFTSFIGTFQKSEVGFGTIVGSAVFNVLFVIGMCSLLSKEVLKLTWWPLFRDSTYYAIGLLVLAIFVGVKGPGEVDLVEALILFLMYLGYILIMGFNEKLYRMITGKDLYPAKTDEETAEVFVDQPTPVSFRRPTTFRAGLLLLIRDKDAWIDKAKVSFVSKLSGDVDDTFDFVDESGDGHISADEMQKFFEKMEDKGITPEEVQQIIAEIDSDGDGMVSMQLSFHNSENMKIYSKKGLIFYLTGL